MAIICWGNLAKSADSTERIEQAIEAYIETHDMNPNAHMGEDYALGVHRLQTVLDHMDGSVNLAKMPNTRMIAICAMESLDAWSYSGNYSMGLMCTEFKISSGSSHGYLRTPSLAKRVKLDFSKNPFFQTTISVHQTTDHDIYIVAGAAPAESKNDSFGFHIDTTTLYAYWTSGGVQHSSEIAGIDLNEFNVFRANYNTTEGKLYFYVNGVLKYSTTSNVPTTTNYRIFTFDLISPDTTGNYTITIADIWLEMDR